MKKVLHLQLSIILSFILLTIPGCKEKKEVPVLTTSGVSDITPATATSGGNIKSDGGAQVTVRGVCWSLASNPVSQLVTSTNDGGGIGSYSSFITGLTSGSTFHVRAYATNSVGTAYGNDVSFTTQLLLAPSVTTTAISAVATKVAISGGNVTDDGGGYLTAGVCLSTSPNPTVASPLVTSEGSGVGAFTSIIPNLSGSTTYYLRAYATNPAATVYGDQITFTTLPGVVDIEGNVYGIANIGTQVWLTDNLATTKLNDGVSIPLVEDQTSWNRLTTKGYCWYNNDKTSYGITNGALYNWHAVNTGKLCPAGWHVPTDAEWTTLISFLGGEASAGNKMSRYIYDTSNSLFWALSCGVRDTITGFLEPGGCSGLDLSRWWSSSSGGTYIAWSCYMSASNQVFKASFSKKYGFSVRCVKD